MFETIHKLFGKKIENNLFFSRRITASYKIYKKRQRRHTTHLVETVDTQAERVGYYLHCNIASKANELQLAMKKASNPFTASFQQKNDIS